MVLPIAPGLRPLVAKHGTEVVHPHRLGEVVHSVFQVGAADRRRTLRAKGQLVPAPVLEGIHLLFHYVGAFPYGPDKEVGILKSWAVDSPEAVAPGQCDGLRLDVSPIFLLLREQVGSASGSLERGQINPQRWPEN